MCVSRITGRNTPALTRTQITMTAWFLVQARQREPRRGYQSVRYSDNETLDQ
jgi:hypothetical protein